MDTIKPITLIRKLPNPLPMRCAESKEFADGRAFRQYQNNEFRISMIATKKSHAQKFTVFWVCEDLKGRFETYEILKKAWEKKNRARMDKGRHFFDKRI
jgi:hypothetical protein